MPSVEIDALESVGQFWTIEVGINACPQRLEDLKIRIDELGYIDEMPSDNSLWDIPFGRLVTKKGVFG